MAAYDRDATLERQQIREISLNVARRLRQVLDRAHYIPAALRPEVESSVRIITGIQRDVDQIMAGLPADAALPGDVAFKLSSATRCATPPSLPPHRPNISLSPRRPDTPTRRLQRQPPQRRVRPFRNPRRRLTASPRAARPPKSRRRGQRSFSLRSPACATRSSHRRKNPCPWPSPRSQSAQVSSSQPRA